MLPALARNTITLSLATFAVACLTVSSAEAQFRRGLKQSTIEVVLNRKQPPKVLIVGSNIKVEVVSQVNGRDNIAQRFATTLETQLLANEPRFRTGQPQPDTVISSTISRLETKQTAGSRQVQVSRQTGTKQVLNKNGKYEDQPVYSLVTETQNFTTVRGDLAVAVQVRDRKTNATLDSQSFSPTYDREFPAGTTPADERQVEQSLIESAVASVAKRLTPTREAVKVMLGRPNDPIDDLNKLGQAGLWSRMLEQLELIKPLPDSKKEAYRIFNMGVANEALAYGTDDVSTSRKLLDQASVMYSKALEMKPDEKYFLSPQTRIAAGLTAYAELDHQQAILTEAAAAPPPAPAQPPVAAPVAPVPPTGARDLPTTAPAATKGSPAMTTKDIVDLVALGIDDDNVLAAIRDAKTVAFDLSVAGLKELASGKVSNRVIAAMRTKQAAKPAVIKK